MEFTVDFMCPEYFNVVNLECESGLNVVDESRKKLNIKISIDKIMSRNCCVSHVSVNLSEDDARRSLCFNNTNFIEVAIKNGLLDRFFYRTFIIVRKSGFIANMKSKVCGRLGKKDYIEVYWKLNKQDLINWWIDSGCPLLVGYDKDPRDKN